MQANAIKNSPSITFVIGAGASREVNMPTGEELKGVIAKSLAFEVDSGQLKGGKDKLREALYLLGQRRPQSWTVNDYLASARLIRFAMPQAPSIDNFIDSHRNDTKVSELGKLAIASAILDAERGSLLHFDARNTHNRMRFDSVADKWLNPFFQLLTLNAQVSDLPSRFAKVCVVSFNYDRVLEHFLHCSLQNYYALSAAEASELLKGLRIFHPYGTVGALPWQQLSTAVPFGGEVYSDTLLKMSGALRTFTEGTDASTSEIDQIRTAVFEAERLVFLGFAYHELNLEVLFGPVRDVPTRHDKYVFGSAYGLSEANKKGVGSDLVRLGKYEPSLVTLRRELTAAQLIPEYSRSLRL